MFFFNKKIVLVCVLLKLVNTNASVTSNCQYGFNGDKCDECGLTYYSQNARIVGGVQAVAHSWPSIAHIVFRYTRSVDIGGGMQETFEFGASCAGTIIDRKTILTAAHCILDEVTYTDINNEEQTAPVEPNSYNPTQGSMFSVYVGLQDKSNLDNLKYPAMKMKVARVVKHENYDPDANTNDIAVLVLADEVLLNQYTQIACLPAKSASFPPANTASYAAGWGTTSSSSSSTSDQLRNVRLTVYDGSSCSQVNDVSSWNGQICAGEIAGGKDTCQGDSGGPLYVLGIVNGKYKYILAGITSYGAGCGVPGYPG